MAGLTYTKFRRREDLGDALVYMVTKGQYNVKEDVIRLPRARSVSPVKSAQTDRKGKAKRGAWSISSPICSSLIL